MEKLNSPKITVPSPAGKAAAKSGGLVVTQKEVGFAVFVIAGFFIGRVLVFDYMNPAMIAYLSTFLGTSGAFYLTCLTALFGMMTNVSRVALIEYFGALALLGMVNYYITQNRRIISQHQKSVAGALCLLTGGMISAALDGMNLYLMIVAAAEALITFSLSFIFICAEQALTKKANKIILSNQQLISISIFMGLCFVGMSGIALQGVFLRDVLSISAVLLMSYAGGPTIGCTAGLIFSLIMFAGAGYSPAYTGILGVAGMMGGVFKDLGKLGSIAGFIFGAVLTALYLQRPVLSVAFFITLVIAACVLLVLPHGLLDRLSYSFLPNSGAMEYEDYIEKLKELTAEKLKGFSESFQMLSGTFSNLTQKKDAMSQKEVSRLIDRVAENICRECPGFDTCWKNHFYSTYQSIFVLLASSDKKGYITARDVPEALTKNCSDLKNFIEVSNRVFQLYKSDVRWHNRIVESRELVAQQLAAVSKIMAELSTDIQYHFSFSEKYEKIIREELERIKIPVQRLIVLKDKHGRYEVDLTLSEDIDARTYGRELLSTISSVLGRSMTREHSSAFPLSKGVHVKIVEERRFQATAAISRAVKGRGHLSGDSYTWMELKDGHCIAALSDGMGSGYKANEESAAAIEILERFLDSGFDKELAIKMINSILILKSDEDFFTTLDLLSINLYTGVGELIKIGAVETYLLRDEKVKVMRQSSLPAGIVNDIEIETASIDLVDGDILLLVSDGITDAGRPKDDRDWIIDALSDFHGVNPQNIADYIVELAKAKSGGDIKDDMTALALRIWEK